MNIVNILDFYNYEKFSSMFFVIHCCLLSCIKKFKYVIEPFKVKFRFLDSFKFL